MNEPFIIQAHAKIPPVIKQATIEREVRFDGRGIFSDSPSSLTLRPAEPDTGVLFVRTDLGDDAVVRVRPSNIVESLNCTILTENGTTVAVVEHLLACLFAIGIDNVIALVDGEELPSESGCASDYFDSLESAGRVEQEYKAPEKKLSTPLFIGGDEKALILFPSDDYSVSYIFDHAHPALGVQFVPETPREKILGELMSARTFITEEDARKAIDAGILKHNNPDRAVLIGKDGPSKELEHPNELARHKAQDIVGDLSIFSPHLKARVIGIRSGHHLNHLAVKRLAILFP